jgi:hypothetical protein
MNLNIVLYQVVVSEFSGVGTKGKGDLDITKERIILL